MAEGMKIKRSLLLLYKIYPKKQNGSSNKFFIAHCLF